MSMTNGDTLANSRHNSSLSDRSASVVSSRCETPIGTGSPKYKKGEIVTLKTGVRKKYNGIKKTVCLMVLDYRLFNCCESIVPYFVKIEQEFVCFFLMSVMRKVHIGFALCLRVGQLLYGYFL